MVKKNGEKVTVNLPPVSQQLTIRQIETAKQKRRAGASIRDIAEDMGISLETVHRYTKGIKTGRPDDEKTVEDMSVRPPVPQPNGGEAPPVQQPKPSKFLVEIEVDPELVLMIAGDAKRLGFPSVTEYLRTYEIPWMAATVKGADIIGAKTPEEYEQRLLEVAKDALAFRKMVKESQKEAEKTVVKRE